MSQHQQLSNVLYLVTVDMTPTLKVTGCKTKSQIHGLMLSQAFCEGPEVQLAQQHQATLVGPERRYVLSQMEQNLILMVLVVDVIQLIAQQPLGCIAKVTEINAFILTRVF